MDLKDIAVITGKPGLFKILKPTRTGVIIEPIGAEKGKTVANASHKISILKEISIYTMTADGSLALEEVFYRLYEKYGNNVPKGRESEDLRAIMTEIVPDHDQAKVYTSDIKKIVAWYEILVQYAPEVLARKEEETTKN